MTDYKAIQKSIELAISCAKDDLNLLESLKADPAIIKSVVDDISNLDAASEIVWMYSELDK